MYCSTLVDEYPCTIKLCTVLSCFKTDRCTFTFCIAWYISIWKRVIWNSHSTGSVYIWTHEIWNLLPAATCQQGGVCFGICTGPRVSIWSRVGWQFVLSTTCPYEDVSDLRFFCIKCMDIDTCLMKTSTACHRYIYMSRRNLYRTQVEKWTRVRRPSV